MPEETVTAPKKPAGRRHDNRGRVKKLVIALVVLAALGVGGYFLYGFLTKPEKVNSQIQTGTADWGSIQSSVSGMGNARAKEFAAITLQNAGIVQSVFVTEGQVVSQGDPLYVIVSPAAQEAYDAAVKQVGDLRETAEKQVEELDRLYKQVTALQKEYSELLEEQSKSNQDRFVTAPFAGQLQEVTRDLVGVNLGKGTKVATLVDDSRFLISFYFSYAYEGMIYVGQSASVTVSGSDIPGRVEEVNMVRRVAPEGSVLFEAVVSVDNPGALTAGVSATCALWDAGGTLIYPYDAAKLRYCRTAEIAAKTSGEVLASNLRDYMDVPAGALLLTLKEEDFSERLQSKRDQISAAQEAVENQRKAIENAQLSVEEGEDKVKEAQRALDDFSAMSPMSGTITSCTLSEGMEVKNGDTVITISNNTTMTVNITVDDRNISYVKPGMGVNLNSYDGGAYYGVVSKIDMSLSGDSIGQGMTNYPVTLEVDNADGSLRDGAWLNYSFVTSQSDSCIVVPMQSVKYMSLEDGSTASVIFIQAESRPANAVDIDLPPRMPGEAPAYPTGEDGYYPVAVSTGLSDDYNVEITEGLQGGETVFVNYFVDQASSWG